MKLPANRSLIGGNSVTLVIVAGVFLLLSIACGGSGTPPPSQYVGFWTGADGTTITIRSDGTADYKSSNTTVTGGGIIVDEAAKTLKITFASIGPSFTIDKSPDANQMTLSGVVYKKGGVAAAPEMPTEPELQDLVKTSLLDFNDAVQSGDFTAFHAKVAKKLQEQKTPDEMKEVFKVFVDGKEHFNLKSSISGMKATFEPSPTFEPFGDDKVLVLKGSYPTTPKKLGFQLKYLKEDGSWKVFGIYVDTLNQ